MSTFFVILLTIAGLFTAGCIWSINLNLKRFPREARLGSIGGLLVVLGMFAYSIHFIKGAAYPLYMLLGLSVGMTVVWVLACGFVIGLLTIIGVGSYWAYTTFKHTSLKEFWEKLKMDFKDIFSKLKNWVDGEEL